MIRKEKLRELKEYIEMYKTIGKETIYKDKMFLNVEACKYYLNDGSSIIRERLVKGGNDGSAGIIIPRLTNGEYLTVIEPRVHTRLTVGVGFPAGYIEEDEDNLRGAIRELKEETGYVSNDIVLLDKFYQDEGCSKALNSIFLALDCKKKYPQQLDEFEKIKYMSFTLGELMYLVREQYIMGVNTKIALDRLIEVEDIMKNNVSNNEKIKQLKKYFGGKYV